MIDRQCEIGLWRLIHQRLLNQPNCAMYRMVKTSVYLDEAQKASLDEAAAVSGLYQANLIRQSLAATMDCILNV